MTPTYTRATGTFIYAFLWLGIPPASRPIDPSVRETRLATLLGAWVPPKPETKR